MKFECKPSHPGRNATEEQIATEGVADFVVVMNDGKTYKASECFVDLYVDEEASPPVRMKLRRRGTGESAVSVLSGWAAKPREDAPQGAAKATHRVESFSNAQAALDSLTQASAPPSSDEFADDEIPF